MFRNIFCNTQFRNASADKIFVWPVSYTHLEFTKAYTSIYTAVSDLRVTYKGEASDTFNQRIEGYKNDFSAAEKALKNYVQFLREYAAKMKSTENDIKSKASSLSVGN